MLLVGFFLMPRSVKADEKQWQPNLPKQAARPYKVRNGRRIASVQNPNIHENYRATRSSDRETDLDIKLSLLAGAGIQSEGSTFSGNTSTQNVGAAPSFGLSVDLRAFRYFGAEEDAYYQMSGSTPDSAGSKDSSQGMGSFTTVKGQLPLQLLGINVAPKAGVGFALLRRVGKSVNQTGSLENSVTGSGVYVTLGVDIEPIRKISISADYARSLKAWAALKNGSSDQDAEAASFDRIRVGAFYQFLPGMHGGLQFTHRGLKYSLPTVGSTVEGSASTNQVQAVFQYEL